MKFGQLIESNNINWGREFYTLVSDFFPFFEKVLYEVKSNDRKLSFSISQQPLTWHMIKTKCIKLDYWSRDLFNVFRKGSGKKFSAKFYVWFFNKNVSYVSHVSLAIFQILLSDYLYFLTIGQYVYCIFLLTKLWRHRFRN